MEINHPSSPEVKNAVSLAKKFAEVYVAFFARLDPASKFEISKTFCTIEHAGTRHELSSVISFDGGINGCVLINYPIESIVEVVRLYFSGNGLNPEEAPKLINDEMVSTVGEITNQLMGHFRSMMSTSFGLTIKSAIPATFSSTVKFGLLDSDAHDYLCVRSQLNTKNKLPVYIEFSVEKGFPVVM